jgi:hypothetical protein
VAEAQALKEVALVVAENAKEKWERVRGIFNRGAANETELDDAREKWESATQSLIAAEESLQQVVAARAIEQAQSSYDAQLAHVKYLETQKAKRYTRAPFDGFVVQEHTYVGQWLSKGDPVITLAKMDEVDVVVQIDQSDIGMVRMGQAANVMIEGAEPNRWSGKIAQIVPQSDWQSGSRGFPVVVRIKNRLETVDVEDGQPQAEPQRVPALKAGMLARVTISGPEQPTLLAPKDALVRTTRGTFVFVFDPIQDDAQFDPERPTAGVVRQVEVEADLRRSEGESIAIRPLDEEAVQADGGWGAGSWVVTEGGERLQPFQDNVNALPRIGTSPS